MGKSKYGMDGPAKPKSTAGVVMKGATMKTKAIKASGHGVCGKQSLPGKKR